MTKIPNGIRFWSFEFGAWVLFVFWDLMIGAFNLSYKKLNISQINLDEMAVKCGTKILAIVTIIIVLISIGFSGCVEEEKDDEINADDKYYIEYSISIKSNNTYIIYAPIVYTDKHSVNEIFSKFKVVNGIIEINKIEITSENEKYFNLTEYPINDPKYPEGNRETKRTNNVGINITGKGNSKIYFKITGDTYYSGLTFGDLYGYGFLIYCKKTNPQQDINISFEMHIKAYNRFMEYEKRENSFYIDNGWNNVGITGYGGIV